MTSMDHRVNRAIDAAIGFTSGIAGGTVNVYVGQPLDTVKVKMQTYPILYKSAFYCFRKTLTYEGIRRGLYCGTTPNLIANMAENSVLFLSYGVCQKAVMAMRGKDTTDALSTVENAFAGSFASLFSATAVCPAELIKCRMQTTREQMKLRGEADVKNKRSWLPIARQVLREDGIRGLFRGLASTVARDSLGYFFFFGGYELSRALLTPPGLRKDDVGTLGTFLSGGIGGMSLWLAVFPFDLAKSRLQVLKTDNHFLTIIIRILKEEGFSSLYKGLAPTLLRTFICSGCLFVTTKSVRMHLNALAYE